MSGDIRVMGLVGGTHIIEDLGIDVPHGATVMIPAAKAHVSKDLWRAISQRCVFQLSSAPQVGSGPTPRSPDHAEIEGLRSQVRQLTEENARLVAALAAKEGESQAKLDAILGLLRAGVSVNGIQEHVRPRSSPPVSDVVSGDVPVFIPSQIKPEGAEVQISTVAEESSGAGVGGAKTALRKLRGGNGNQ